MMHELEKSDSFIVAVKPTNKQGQPSAEPVERREGTKGNSGETRMRRTLSRGSVPQGLDRVRQATFFPLPSITQGRSPVRELRTPGSVRGAPRKEHPYRDIDKCF